MAQLMNNFQTSNLKISSPRQRHSCFNDVMEVKSGQIWSNHGQWSSGFDDGKTELRRLRNSTHEMMNSISTLFRGPPLHVFAVAFVLLVLYNGCSSIGTLVTGFSLGYQQTATWHSRQHQPHYSRTLKRIQATGTSTPSDMKSAKKKDKNDGLRLIDDEDDDDVEFPPPLSGYDRLKRAATFWSTALPIVASYYGLISQIKLRELLAGGEALPEEQVRALWDAQHQDGATKLADTITHLKGFYVKTAQIISSRQDLFPSQYTDALAGFTDNLDPMPVSLAKKVIESELLTGRGDDESFADVFSEFDEIPLGAASVAQVHRAVLTAKYGGPRVVAVKIQRPSIESKLLGDVANLKAIAKTFRDTPTLPLDYYTVFCELEKQLADEFDFVKEAVAMDRIYQSLIRAPNGSLRDMPLVMPRPVPGLISRRVLVMDYLDGVPLSRSREEMIKKGIDPDSPEAKLFGKKLLDALTEAFGRNILETGFFHADPHPGNIFVLSDGRPGLIDFGQVKQISGRNRETLCKTMIALADRKRDGDDEDGLTPEDMELAGKMAIELGVEIKPTAQKEAAAAVALWLFDGTVKKLPGGYDMGELSPNSPVKELKSFPQDLVLVGRSTILIKGIAARLGITHSLAAHWAPIARQVLANDYSQHDMTRDGGSSKVRFRDVLRTLRQWGKGRATGLVRRLPSPIRSRIAAYIVRRQERQARKALTTRRRQRLR